MFVGSSLSRADHQFPGDDFSSFLNQIQVDRFHQRKISVAVFIKFLCLLALQPYNYSSSVWMS